MIDYTMIYELDFSVIFTRLLFLSLAYFIYCLTLKPYLLVHFYKRQHVPSKFIPLFATCTKQIEEVIAERNSLNVSKKGERHEQRYEALITNTFNRVELVILDPDLINEMYSDPALFKKSNYLKEVYRSLLPFSLQQDNDEIGEKHRKILLTKLNAEYVKEMSQELAIYSDEFYQSLQKANLNQIKAKNIFSNFSAELVGRLFYGNLFKEYTQIKGQQVGEFVVGLADRLSLLNSNPLFLLLKHNYFKFPWSKNSKEINNDIREFRLYAENLFEVKKRSFEQERNTLKGKRRLDLVDLLLMERENPNLSTEETMSDQEIIETFISFMISATAYFSLLFTMATYYLQFVPEFKSKIDQEVSGYFVDTNKVNFNTLGKLEYTNALIKETLRMTSLMPVTMLREAARDCRLGHLHIKKGTQLVPGLIVNNFDPKIHNSPDFFDPERWINESKTMESVRENPNVFAPFGFAPRNCVGQMFSIVEGKVGLGMFLRNFDYKLVGNEQKLRMTQQFVCEQVDDIQYELTNKRPETLISSVFV